MAYLLKAITYALRTRSQTKTNNKQQRLTNKSCTGGNLFAFHCNHSYFKRTVISTINLFKTYFVNPLDLTLIDWKPTRRRSVVEEVSTTELSAYSTVLAIVVASFQRPCGGCAGGGTGIFREGCNRKLETIAAIAYAFKTEWRALIIPILQPRTRTRHLGAERERERERER